MKRTYPDLTGSVFHSWTVVRYSHNNENGRRLWMCRCKCGKMQAICTNNLQAGRTKMCRRCSSAVVGNVTHKTHGRSHTRMYRTWQAIKRRCRNDSDGLGLQMFAGWLDDYAAFDEYVLDALGEITSSRAITIGRRDPYGHYVPGNLKWSSPYAEMVSVRRVKEQRKNELLFQATDSTRGTVLPSQPSGTR